MAFQPRINALTSLTAAIAVVAALVVPTAARALPGSSDQIVLQGYVTNVDGTPVDGVFEATISLWDAEIGGTRLWVEVQVLPVADGIFTTVLGVATPLPPEILDGSPLYVEVTFSFLPPGPRKPLVSTSVPEGADRSFGFAFDAVEVTVVFDQVTDAGTANATYSNEAPPLPEDFDAGDMSYVDVSTTAAFTGAVTVCLTTNPESYSDPDNLYLLHYENGAWVDLLPLVPFETTLTDSSGGLVEGIIEVHFVMYDSPEGITRLWEESLTESVTAGHYRTLLGSGLPLPREFFDGTVRYMGIRVEEGSEQLPLLPFAPDAMCGQVSSFSPFVVAERKSRTVSVDIFPGNPNNPVNPRSQGTIPVAILSSAEFDAPSEVIAPSLTFGRTGEEESLAGCMPGGLDVNGDGFPDLVCRFFTQATGFSVGDTMGFLRAATIGGTRIDGADGITIVGR